MEEMTVYVVTGGNRGIGLGLVESLLSRPHTIVIASVRNAEAAAQLKSRISSTGQDSTLHILELDFSIAPSPPKILEALKATVPDLDHVDVLINNAAYISPLSIAAEISLEDLRQSFETNTYTPLMVFQAFWPLLQRSASAPKVIMVSSSVGSIGDQEPMPGGAYGPSKAALNWITRALHLQNEGTGLIAVALHPGWVQTDSGRFSASEWNYAPGPPHTLEESIAGMLSVIDNATRDSVSGSFVSFTGQVLSW